MPDLDVRSVYEQLCDACGEKDTEKVSLIVPMLLKALGVKASVLAHHLGISDLTIYRWQATKGRYAKTVPQPEILEKLGLIIGRAVGGNIDLTVESIPEDLPPAYFIAVAATQAPSTKYLRLLSGVERMLEGTVLKVETCQMILRDYEDARFQDQCSEEKEVPCMMLPMLSVLEQERLNSLYEELVQACNPKDRDIYAVGRCVREISETLDFSAMKLAGFLEVSDQTVLRWQHLTGPYRQTIPSKRVLGKLRELIDLLSQALPEYLPAGYFRAVAETKTPSTDYLRLLVEMERALGGTQLSEEACKLILRDFEAKSGAGS